MTRSIATWQKAMGDCSADQTFNKWRWTCWTIWSYGAVFIKICSGKELWLISDQGILNCILELGYDSLWFGKYYALSCSTRVWYLLYNWLFEQQNWATTTMKSWLQRATSSRQWWFCSPWCPSIKSLAIHAQCGSLSVWSESSTTLQQPEFEKIAKRGISGRDSVALKIP